MLRIFNENVPFPFKIYFQIKFILIQLETIIVEAKNYISDIIVLNFKIFDIQKTCTHIQWHTFI